MRTNESFLFGFLIKSKQVSDWLYRMYSECKAERSQIKYWNNFLFTSSIKSVSYCEIRRQQQKQQIVCNTRSSLFFPLHNPNKRRRHHRLTIWELNWNSELIFRNKAFHKEKNVHHLKICYEMYTYIALYLTRTTAAQQQRQKHYHHHKNICMRVEKLWYTSSLLMPDNLASLHRWFDIKQQRKYCAIPFTPLSISLSYSLLSDYQLNLPRGQICCISYFSSAVWHQLM